MTFEELQELRRKINEEAEQRRVEVSMQFAILHNTVKIGDIITDHIGSIKVEKIRVYNTHYYEKPCCIYSGRTLKKDGTPTKKNEIRDVWQTNLV